MKTKLALAVIIIVGFFLRFYMLGSVPAGLTSDEADTGYDAYSILVSGRDQWGQFLPITSFKGFGDNRSPLYTYLVVPFVGLFDLSPFAVRLPSALATPN
jgi:4-amino-4-deoxy-L-arabinose transferase-like glycosyltransferase